MKLVAAIAALMVAGSAWGAELKWNARGKECRVVFVERGGAGVGALVERVEVGGEVVARDIDLVVGVTTGKRVPRPGVSYIFFDYPAGGQYGAVERFEARPSGEVVVKGNEARVGAMKAGVFSGEMVVRVYEGSPLIHVEAEMGCDGERVAYAYEPLVAGKFEKLAWMDNRDVFHRESPAGEMHGLAVRNRCVMGEQGGSQGTLALFALPHAYMFPRDYSTNFGFVKVGGRGMGLREDLESGNKYVPWADAPKGRVQHMGFFLLPSMAKAEGALEEVRRYTHGDAYVPMEGRVTFLSHMHAAMTMHQKEGKPNAPAVKKVLKGMGVDVFHPSEFHGDGHSFDTGRVRLEELKGMFDLCREMSDEKFTMIPGEEANAYFGGHYVYLFPRPVYLTLKPAEGKAEEEEVEGFGVVHHPANAEQLAALVKKEGGLVWTTHPRVKGSEGFPDRYREQAWYRDGLWLGGTWKAMPADLSNDRLGVRGFGVLDEMNTWGQRKYVVGEVDTFDLDPTHEFYGHACVNYLKVDRRPTAEDWSPVLKALRAGDFFVTTGEVLIHSADVVNGKVRADVEWTFPLKHAEVVTCVAGKVSRKSVGIEGSGEFGRKTFEWEMGEEKPDWWRVEVWDVGMNGAFTEPK